MSTVPPDLRPRASDTSDPPFAVAPDIVVDLPMPPSVNRLWRATGSDRQRVYLAPAYVAWKHRADMVVISNRQAARGRTLRDGFEAHIGIHDTPRRGPAGDLDNRVKAVLDYLQSREFIANDRLCQRLTVERVHVNAAPHGCRVTLRAMEVRW